MKTYELYHEDPEMVATFEETPEGAYITVEDSPRRGPYSTTVDKWKANGWKVAKETEACLN